MQPGPSGSLLMVCAHTNHLWASRLHDCQPTARLLLQPTARLPADCTTASDGVSTHHPSGGVSTHRLALFPGSRSGSVATCPRPSAPSAAAAATTLCRLSRCGFGDMCRHTIGRSEHTPSSSLPSFLLLLLLLPLLLRLPKSSRLFYLVFFSPLDGPRHASSWLSLVLWSSRKIRLIMSASSSLDLF
jgi:hypothetical protein